MEFGKGMKILKSSAEMESNYLCIMTKNGNPHGICVGFNDDCNGITVTETFVTVDGEILQRSYPYKEEYFHVFSEYEWRFNDNYLSEIFAEVVYLSGDSVRIKRFEDCVNKLKETYK